jgi:nitroimidazol reductase NimA-like FMN-containing flavoprotein (pyridoxamine 5'-phosphate oxidase superfamily)
VLITELTPAECRDVLARSGLARLACARDNQPYIVPIHCYFDGECLYGFSLVGQKIDWMRENPKVCLEIDSITHRYHWTTVVLFGTFEEVLNTPEHAALRRKAYELFEDRTKWWLPGAATVTGTRHHTPVVFRIHIAHMSGRRTTKE